MRWLTVAVALSMLVLVGAGCGGDDETASDTTTLTDTTDETTTIDETTTDGTTTEETDSDDLDFDLATGECAELVEAGTKLSEAFGAAGSGTEDLDDVSTFFDEFADSAPEEIRADFQVLADAWDEYAEILPELQVEPGQTPDPEALAKLQQALASIDQQDVAAASQRITAWAEENCPSG